MTTPPNRDAALAWYQAQADAAQAPQLRQLLREARLRIGGMDPLALRIDDMLGGRTSEDRDLVLTELPNGEHAWLRADLTVRDRRP